jgi:MSHA biogenesis protein MshL
MINTFLLALLLATLAGGSALAAPAAKPARAAAAASSATPTTAYSSMSFGNVNAAGRFDLSINNAPAAQAYMQLGYDTPYNVLVNPDVVGNISITLKNTTVLEALESLRELYGYDFRVAGNRIFVQPNGVQTRMFRVNYLPGRRQGASDIHVTNSSITQSNAGSSGSNGSSSTGGGSTGSSGSPTSRSDDSSSVRTTSDADFWREVQASLTSLVGSANQRSVTLNPAAGVIVVRATPAELRQVEAYLAAVQLSIERQVMLEAKIVEVELGSDAQSGVNWAGFGNLGSGKLSLGVGAPGATIGSTGTLGDGVNTAVAGANLVAGALGRGFYGLAFQATNFASLINYLQTQGNVSVLSSPRIATLNNQKAVLKVGSDELYVTGVSSSTTSTGSSSTTSPSVTLQPFFSGIALDVTPQIDEAGNVMLHVHPSISTVREKQKNINLGSLGAYSLPLAASTINETDSIVRLKDGQIVAIGGLMLQESRDERTGVPVLGSLPFVGGLFRQSSVVTRKREVVILIKPSVIREDGSWPEPDHSKPAAAAPAAPPMPPPGDDAR